MDPTSCSVVFGFGVTCANAIFFSCLSGYVLIYMHHQELIMSERSDGSQSPLFWIRVTVWFLVSDTHKVMTATHSCCISFGFSGTDTTFIFNVLLWSFLYNLIDIVSSLPSLHGSSPWHFSGVAYFRISSCLKRLTIFGGRYLSLIALLIETCY